MGTLIGYPASYGSEDQLNDHHFHYGYFLRAAAEVARRDPAWANGWGGMVGELIRDIACPDRGDARYPFLRNFDPYAGHTWASAVKFADGNNNESSSEAIPLGRGLVLWAEFTTSPCCATLASICSRPSCRRSRNIGSTPAATTIRMPSRRRPPR
ncbi:MAG: glycosyl hydrolase [Verrucomicrobiales bacterium]